MNDWQYCNLPSPQREQKDKTTKRSQIIHRKLKIENEPHYKQGMNLGCGGPSSSCVTSGIRRIVNVDNPVITQYWYMIKMIKSKNTIEY